MKTKRRFVIAGIVTGSLLTLAPVFGMLGSVFAMAEAFNTMSSSGVSDPRTLSANIGASLSSTALGLFSVPRWHFCTDSFTGVLLSPSKSNAATVIAAMNWPKG